MVVVFLTMTGCKKDGGTNSTITQLEGFWAASPTYGSYIDCNYRDPVYEFISNNTAFEYVNVYDDYVSGLSTNSMPEHQGWYYDLKKSQTYVFSENKVIFTNGDIYTLVNGKLYKDNSSTVLSPWPSGSSNGGGNGNQNPQDEELTNKLKNTSWEFVKSVTYYKTSGKTETDSHPYGTVSFRSSFSGNSTTWRILTVNEAPLGIWRFEDGILRIGLHLDYSDDPDAANLLINVCMGGTIEQLTSSALVTVHDSNVAITTYHYTSY